MPGADWIPGVGEAVMVGRGLYPAGDWAYHNIFAVHQAFDNVGNWIRPAGGSVGHVFIHDLANKLP